MRRDIAYIIFIFIIVLPNVFFYFTKNRFYKASICSLIKMDVTRTVLAVCLNNRATVAVVAILD